MEAAAKAQAQARVLAADQAEASLHASDLEDLAAATLTDLAASGDSSGAAAASAVTVHTFGYAPLMAAAVCLFAAGMVLEKARAALNARPV
jgi:hypothetical protein